MINNAGVGGGKAFDNAGGKALDDPLLVFAEIELGSADQEVVGSEAIERLQPGFL